MTPQQVYDSKWLLPILPWVVSAIVVALALPRATKSFAHGWAAIFAILITIDAWLNGPYTPIAANTAGATAAGVAFVIVGDFRYFIAVERYLGGKAIGMLVRAVVFAFVVPLAMQAGRAAWPAVFGSGRTTFLAYETLFLALAITLRLAVLPRRLSGATAEDKRVVLTLTHFELVQYALWATADVLLLVLKIEAGYFLRIVPNLLYYVVFVPYAKRVMR